MSIKLTTFEQQVLDTLRRRKGNYLNFGELGSATGLDRRTVQLACQQLARHGLAKYGHGLTATDNGSYAGAGYTALSDEH